jgi:hypothetical protein
MAGNLGQGCTLAGTAGLIKAMIVGR